MKETISLLKTSRKVWLIAVSSLLLMIVYLYHGTPSFYIKVLKSSQLSLDVDFQSRVYQNFSSFFLFLLVPVFIIKVILREKLSDYGFSPGNLRFGLKFVVIALLIFLPFLYISSLTPDFKSEYPLPIKARSDLHTLIKWEVFYFFYYAGWEAFYRGFMLFGLQELGLFASILIETSTSTLMHIGKPEGEILAALFAGFLFGAVALRTRSFIPVLLLHYLVGLFTDIFCFMNQ